MVARLVTLLSDELQVFIVLCSRHYGFIVLTISKKSVYTMKECDEYCSEGIKTM